MTHSSNLHAGNLRMVGADGWEVCRCIVLVLLLTMSTIMMADDADPGVLIPFDIPQQRADVALTLFAEQADRVSALRPGDHL